MEEDRTGSRGLRLTVALEKEQTKQEKKEYEEENKQFYVDSDIVEVRATCIYIVKEKWVHNDNLASFAPKHVNHKDGNIIFPKNVNKNLQHYMR